MIADPKIYLKMKPKTDLNKKIRKSLHFFILYERMKLGREKSKILKIREIYF